MPLHSALRDPEPTCDLFVLAPRGDETDDLPLARSQCVPARDQRAHHKSIAPLHSSTRKFDNDECAGDPCLAHAHGLRTRAVSLSGRRYARPPPFKAILIAATSLTRGVGRSGASFIRS